MASGRNADFRVELTAFTRTELLALIAILIVLVGIVGKQIGKRRHYQLQRQCVNNLKDVGLAFRIFATDGGDRMPFDISTNQGGSKEYTNVWQHFLVISNELAETKFLVCPEDAKSPAATWPSLSDKNVSYSVGLTAAETLPQSFLSGDASFQISGAAPGKNPIELTPKTHIAFPAGVHGGVGNICMGDGSVSKLNREGLAKALRYSGLETNVLLLPR